MQEILAFNVLRRMEELGVTIPQLAEACEVSVTNIRLLMQGEQFISARVLACVCNALNVSPCDLFKELPHAEETSA